MLAQVRFDVAQCFSSGEDVTLLLRTSLALAIGHATGEWAGGVACGPARNTCVIWDKAIASEEGIRWQLVPIPGVHCPSEADPLCLLLTEVHSFQLTVCLR